jgi:hypothetical protein
MAEPKTQKIQHSDGTVTVISDTYAPFGTLPITAERADDPARWQPKRISEREVLKRYGWTPADRRRRRATVAGDTTFGAQCTPA